MPQGYSLLKFVMFYGNVVLQTWFARAGSAEPEEGKGKKKTADKSADGAPAEEGKGEDGDAEGSQAGEGGEAGSTVKSAAQKKKEKKERERLKKQAQKQVRATEKLST